VIYAAEEPITLAQLASIFADEALALKAAADLPLEATQPEKTNESVSEAADGRSLAEPVADPASVATDETAESGEQPSLPMEDAEARKRARLREREAKQALQPIVDELITEYGNGDRGMEIREIAGGYRMATKAEYHDAVRSFVKSLKPQMKLSLQALETLAVIAYKQPVTAPEISEIRGVDTSGVLGGLMSRKLITTARQPRNSCCASD
jgi:segregation and condensation protein B